MRAITLHQPWASQIFDPRDPKNVENRGRLTPSAEILKVDPGTGRRPFIAVHAGLVYDASPKRLAEGTDSIEHAGSHMPFPKGTRVPEKDALPYGRIIGIARVKGALDKRGQYPRVLGVDGKHLAAVDPRWRELVDLERARWWLGPVGWLLVDAIPIEPFLCRGMLGLWSVPNEIELEVRRRAAASVRAECDGRAYEGAPNNATHYDRRMPRMSVHDLAHALEDLS